jgi:manganese efflux pump family protein
METIEIIFIALGLAMDAFAVALGVGSSRYGKGPRPAFRISFHFGLFQFIMPVIGWYIGYTIEPVIQAFDHWIAFALLAYVGGKMIRAGSKTEPENQDHSGDPTTGWTLVILSIATSIDALAVGLSLSIIRIDIWYPSIIIGVVAGILSLVGLRLGLVLGKTIGKKMEIVGGIILCVIGIRILIQHIS